MNHSFLSFSKLEPKINLIIIKAMIKTILYTRISTPFKNLLFHQFSTLSDPFYILGVEKNAEFSDIKKQFYKLANEYHPDKNNSPEAIKKFLLVKEAFEAIKMQKGLTVPQGYVYDNEDSSMRPNPSQFMTDDEENRHTNADYRMYQEKAEAGGEQYERFKGTFKTIHDINDIKIKVEDGKLKDSVDRFSMNKVKAKIQALSEGGTAYLMIAGISLFFYLATLGSTLDQKKEKQMMYAQDKISEKEKRKGKLQFQSQEIKKKKLRLEQLKKDPDLMEYEKLKKLTNNKREEVITSDKISV